MPKGAVGKIRKPIRKIKKTKMPRGTTPHSTLRVGGK